MTRRYHPSPGLRASDIVWPRTDGYEPIEPADNEPVLECPIPQPHAWPDCIKGCTCKEDNSDDEE